MLKLMLLCLLLLAAYAIAVILIRRLADTSRQLGELRQDMNRNDERLRLQMEQLKAREAVDAVEPEVKQ